MNALSSLDVSPSHSPELPVTNSEAAPRTRVLIVDDEPVLRRAFSRVLQAAGYAVDVAADGAQAAAAVADGDFDIVLTDIDMPGMGGLALLRAVRARHLDVPVLLITGNPAVDTAVEALEHGAMRYLIKPIDNQLLLGAVRQAARLREMAKVRREALRYLGGANMQVGDRAGLEASFARALETLWMAYQPITSWSRRATFAWEALVRTAEPTLPNPNALFTAAERLDKLDVLGRLIRSKVAQAARQLPAACLFVNLHPRDLLDEELYDPRAPLSQIAHRVVLEITERAALDDVGDVRLCVKRLRALGFRIAVDDLGAGYAGLSSFAQLEPEVVKLDGSLVRAIGSEPMKRKLVRSMVSLCNEMGLLLVAEGVETASERDALVELGCDLLQGYLFARPQRLVDVD